MGKVESIVATVVVFSFMTSTGFTTAAFAVSSSISLGSLSTPGVGAGQAQKNLIRVMEAQADVHVPANGGQAGVTAYCPTGWVATGGGYLTPSAAGVFVYLSEPSAPNGWFVAAINTTPDSQDLIAKAMCARVPLN